MGRWFVNPPIGVDTNDGLSPDAPLATRQRASVLAGGNGLHEILVKAGTTEIITATFNLRSGGSPSARFKFGTYGGTAPARMLTTTDINEPAYILSTSKHITVENWDFDAGGVSDRAFQIQASTAAIEDIEFSNCGFLRATGNGIFINSTNTFPLLSNVRLKRCRMRYNNGHGALAIGEIYGITYDECEAGDNSRTGAEHGFSSFAQRNTVTSGWILVSGTQYRRAITTADVYMVISNSGTWPRLTENTSTPTSLVPGQFGVDGVDLHVDFGVNPNTLSVSYSHTQCRGIRYLYCKAYGTRSSDTIEGTGIQFDDMTSDSEAIGCEVFDNAGVGITSNGGINNKIIACVVYNNGRRGINAQKGGGHLINHNLCDRNNRTLPDLSEIAISQLSTNTQLANNVVRSSVEYGILCGSDSASGSTAQSNNVRGQTATAIEGLTDTSMTTADPKVGEDHAVGNRELWDRGVFVGGKDYYGNDFQNPPSVGPVQVQRARTARRAFETA